MLVPRPYQQIRTAEQWLRASFNDCALLNDTALLAWEDSSLGAGGVFPPALAPAGLAFDQHCRLFHSDREDGRVERLLWASNNPLSPSQEQSPAALFFAEQIDPVQGEFSTIGFSRGPLREPAALAADKDDRLYIVESGANRILVFDLWGERVVREIYPGATPLDLAPLTHGAIALCKTPESKGLLLRLNGRADPAVITWPDKVAAASRVAVSPSCQIYLLLGAGTAKASLVRAADGLVILAQGKIPFTSDIEFQTNDVLNSRNCPTGDVLVIARRPGEEFLRFCLDDKVAFKLPPLKARGYDGRGIVRAPDGRIGFWTTQNLFQHAVAARVRYKSPGSVTIFRLDSGDFHTQWGRVFVEACIPGETEVTIRCVATDEPPDDESVIPQTRPANIPEDGRDIVRHPELSPPMPAVSIDAELSRQPAQALHQRETGREIPWVRLPAGDSFEVYEAPILATPGRYLWIRLELTGNSRVTPRVRALRAEFPTHDYLRKLPKVFSRDPGEASFLNRYLAIFEGMLGDWEARADARGLLLDPRSAPAELLPWLAGFVGLVLDERMASARRPGGQTRDVRRDLIRESADLFRFRGTIHGLKRFLQIYLEVEPIIIEKFRARGLGAGVLGASEGLNVNSVLGAGFRVGGAVGNENTEFLGANLEDAFSTHAHRFTVALPIVLLDEELELVRNILEVHRPAHTLVEICTVGSGLRVGVGSHIGLTAFIGKTGGFNTAQIGGSLVGRDSIIGKPAAGSAPASARIGIDTHVG